jgi:HlyD family type I secretion membrane fusion protein
MQPSNSPPRRANWPDKIAAVSTNSRRAMLLGFGLIGACVFGFGIWGTTAPIASAVVANGQVVVASKRKQIQHPVGGVVRILNVEDGAAVKQGAILLQLDDADAADRYTRTRDAFYLALATEARLQAETADLHSPKFEGDLAEAAARYPSVKSILEGQRRLFKARRLELRGQLSILEAQHRQLKSELDGVAAERRAADEQIAMTKGELAVVEDLFVKGYTTRTRVFSLRREIAQLGGASGRGGAWIARTRTAMIESELKLEQAKHQLQTQIAGELHEFQAKIPNLREQFRAADQAFERMTIRAPVDGTVMASRATTLGSVVRAGETILEIVPDADRLMIEVQLSPIDVDSVGVGLHTEIHLTGLNARDSVPLQGQITHVSADAMQDTRTNAAYFVAHVDVPDSELKRMGATLMQPGMPASVMIKTGERTALAYLTQPLTDTIAKAWREE